MLKKRGCFVAKRTFWLYIIVQVKYYHTLLLVFEYMRDKGKRKKKVEITLHGIIAHHGWAAELNNRILLQWFPICMC